MSRRLLLAGFGAWVACAGLARAQDLAPAGEDPIAIVSRDVARAGIDEPLGFAQAIAKGRALLRARKYLDAADQFLLAGKLAPAHPLPEFLFAHACYGAGGWQEASGRLRRGLGLYPRWRDLRYPIARDFADGDEWAACVRTLEALRDREPVGEVPRQHYAFLLGYAYAGSGEVSKARLAFREAAEGRAPMPEARAYLETLDRPATPTAPARPEPGRGAPAAGLAPAGAGATASPSAEPDPFRRGNALVLAGRYGEAADAFAEAVIEDPGGMNGILAHFELSHACFAIGRYSEAVTAIRRGLRRYPDWGRVKLNRRDWYPADRPGDFEEHLRGLEAAVEAAPGNARLRFLLGYTAYFVGRRAQAKAAFEAVVAAGPDADARGFLDLLAEAERLIPAAPAPATAPAPARPERASDSERVERAPAEGGSVDAATAAARFAARDYAGAFTAYRDLSARAPDDSDLRFAAARAGFAAGEWKAAVAELRAGLRLHPTAEWARLPLRWKDAFPDPADFDAALDRLRAQVEGLDHFADLDLRFLLAVAYLYNGREARALEQFRVHHALDEKATDAEARAYWELLLKD